MRTTAERYIDASKEATEKLAKAFGCTDKFVYMALTYRKNGENARKIRHAAVKGIWSSAHVPLSGVPDASRHYGGRPQDYAPDV